MPKKSPPPAPYAPEFRQRMVELVRSGRTPASLAKDFPPSAQTIANWVKQADLDEGRRNDGLTTDEREELVRLRRENKVLQEEREILKNSRPGPSRKRTGRRRSVPVREGAPGRAQCSHHVSSARDLDERVLRGSLSAALDARQERRRAHRAARGRAHRVARHVRRTAPPRRAQGERHPRRQEARRAPHAKGRARRNLASQGEVYARPGSGRCAFERPRQARLRR
jgi:transposase